MGRESIAPSVKCSMLIVCSDSEHLFFKKRVWGGSSSSPSMLGVLLCIAHRGLCFPGYRTREWDPSGEEQRTSLRFKGRQCFLSGDKKTRALKFGQPTCQSGRNMTWENKSLIWAAEMEMEESQQGCTLWMHLSQRPNSVAPINCPFAQSGVGFCNLLQETSFSKTPIRS